MGFKTLINSLLHNKENKLVPLTGSLLRAYSTYRKAKGSVNTELLCLAPFNSMRFNRSGGVTPCCQNYNLDSLSGKSLYDVWHGETYAKLRQHIKKNDLSYYCDFCNQHLKNKNFAAVLARHYDFHAINPSGFPSYMEFSMDNTCNLACIMCNSSLSDKKKSSYPMPQEKPFRYGKAFFDELALFIPHLKAVNFSGGEPFLINDYYKIWELMLQLNPNLPVSVTTNGTVLSDRVKSILDKGNFNICVSIDSLKKEVYESIRVNARLEQTLKNIDYFIKYCEKKNTNFSFVICPMRNNADEIPYMVQYANDKGIEINFNIVTKPFELALWTLSEEEIEELIDYCELFKVSQNNAISKNNKEKYNGLIENYKQWLINAQKIQKEFNKINKEQILLELTALIKIKIDKGFETIGNIGDNQMNKPMLDTKTNIIISKIPELLLATPILSVFEKLPDTFLVNEFYFQSVETTLDNICSLCYYSI